MGLGVAKDVTRSLQWYLKSAEQGYAQAQLAIGNHYLLGEGLVQDYVAAHMWLNLSRAQGNDYAKQLLDVMVELMTNEQIAEAQKLAREWQASHP